MAQNTYSDAQSQIAAQLEILRENNARRNEEKKQADKAMSEGYSSEPVAEQVKPNANKKNKKKKKQQEKKTVSVNMSDLLEAENRQNTEKEAEKAAGEVKEAEPVRTVSVKKEPEYYPPEPEAEEKTEDAAHDEEAATPDPEPVSIPAPAVPSPAPVPKAPEPTKDQSEEAPAPAHQPTPAADTNPRHRGHHASLHRKVKYVDMSGNTIKDFYLVEDATGELFKVTDDATIGRSDSSDIVISNRYVSGTHARITREAESFYIEDLGSTNGTSVNGKPVTGKVPIELGDRIVLADTKLTFRTL